MSSESKNNVFNMATLASELKKLMNNDDNNKKPNYSLAKVADSIPTLTKENHRKIAHSFFLRLSLLMKERNLPHIAKFIRHPFKPQEQILIKDYLDDDSDSDDENNMSPNKHNHDAVFIFDLLITVAPDFTGVFSIDYSYENNLYRLMRLTNYVLDATVFYDQLSNINFNPYANFDIFASYIMNLRATAKRSNIKIDDSTLIESISRNLDSDLAIATILPLKVHQENYSLSDFLKALEAYSAIKKQTQGKSINNLQKRGYNNNIESQFNNNKNSKNNKDKNTYDKNSSNLNKKSNNYKNNNKSINQIKASNFTEEEHFHQEDGYIDSEEDIHDDDDNTDDDYNHNNYQQMSSQNNKKKFISNVLLTKDDKENDYHKTTLESKTTDIPFSIIDSGCFTIISNRRQIIHDFKPINETFYASNQSTIEVTGKGYLLLKFAQHQVKIPTFYSNEILLTLINDNIIKQYGIEYDSSPKLKYKDVIIPLSRFENYPIIPDIFVPVDDTSTRINSREINNIHEKLLHPSEKYLQQMLKKKLIQSKDKIPTSHYCPECPKNKGTQKRHIKGSREKFRPTTALSVLHLDIVSLLDVYVLSIIDDFSKMSFSKTIENKSCPLVTQTLTETINQIKTQFGVEVKSVFSDNGTEFTGDTFKKMVKDKGLIHLTSTTYSPSENSTVERFNGTLINKFRAAYRMLKSIPKEFRYKSAVDYANIIYNISYHNSIETSPLKFLSEQKQSDSPYFNYTKINWDKIPVLGSTCQVLIQDVPSHYRKVTGKTRNAIFVGLLFNQKLFYYNGVIIKSNNYKFDSANKTQLNVETTREDDDLEDAEEFPPELLNPDTEDFNIEVEEEDNILISPRDQHNTSTTEIEEEEQDVFLSKSEEEDNVRIPPRDQSTTLPTEVEEEEQDIFNSESEYEPQSDSDYIDDSHNDTDIEALNDSDTKNENQTSVDPQKKIFDSAQQNTPEAKIYENESTTEQKKFHQDTTTTPSSTEADYKHDKTTSVSNKTTSDDIEPEQKKNDQDITMSMSKQSNLEQYKQTMNKEFTFESKLDIQSKPKEFVTQETIKKLFPSPLPEEDNSNSESEEDNDKNVTNIDKNTGKQIDELNSHTTTKINKAVTPIEKKKKRPYQFTKQAEENLWQVIKKRKIINNIKKLLASDERHEWLLAIHMELQTLIDNHTFVEKIVDKNADLEIIPTTWVLNKKTLEDNSIKYKARLCCRGDLEVENDDPVYAPTLPAECLRMGIANAVNQDHHIFQVDITAAYTTADINKTTYISKPMFYGYYQKATNILPNQRLILQLNKSLYGLRTSGRNFYFHLRNVLQELNFIRNDAFPCIYKTTDLSMVIMTFVDDLIITAKNQEDGENFIESLKKHFNLKILTGVISNDNKQKTITKKILGIELKETFNNKGDRIEIALHQMAYTKSIIKEFLKPNIPQKPTPPTDYLRHTYIIKDEQDHEERVRAIRRILGKLIYLSIHTRPDIIFCTSHLAHYQLEPSDKAFNYVERILRYLKETQSHGIKFTPSNNQTHQLECFTDASYNSSPQFKSTIGHVTFYENGPISWICETNKLATLSPAEAEIIAIGQCLKNEIYLKECIQYISGQPFENSIIHSDSTAAILSIHREDFNKKNRHICIRLAFIRQYFILNYFNLSYLSTKEQIADILTKPLPILTYKYLANKITQVQ